MADELKKMAKAHTIYKLEDGTRVPGVTTVCGLLNKPALVLWANRLGLQGIDTTKYVDESAKIGTLIHAMVEHHIKKEELDTSEYSKKEIDLAENGFIKYLEWEGQQEIEPIGNEIQLVSEEHKFGGTIDFLCKLNGVETLVDFKSGSGIYNEHFLQTSAYFKMAREKGYNPQQILILNIGRNENENFATQLIKGDTIDNYFEIFKNLLSIYNIKKILNWR